MSRAIQSRDLLLMSIRRTARNVVECEIPVAWRANQLVALVRFFGYEGYDYPMPDAFEEFDHVMTDLECFPDGRMTTDEDMVDAARRVLAAAEAAS
jgi:hypothetical protein